MFVENVKIHLNHQEGQKRRTTNLGWHHTQYLGFFH
jgi:hypothetical protein